MNTLKNARQRVLGTVLWGSALSSSIISASSLAQGNASTAAPSDVDESTLEEVVVSGHPLSGEGLAQPFAVLDGEALKRARAASIGETLMGLPSVTTTSFGQAVGRPVVRGLGGPRVKVLEDRIDT
ncbi:MAG: Plug domain-containing protein, partial [Halioglobus sp.]|nr:Plug domain-containing protein [Halioglobus sp.]